MLNGLDRLQRFLIDREPTITISRQGPQIMVNASWVESAPYPSGDSNGLDGFNAWAMGDTVEEAFTVLLGEQGY